MEYPSWVYRCALGIASVLALLLTWNGISAAAQLTLTWIHDSTATLGFSIERATGSGGTFAQLATTAAGVTSYIDPTVAAGVTYCYRVRATAASGYSGYSNTACGAAAATATLAVLREGTADGTVTSAPAGINCGATCSADYPGGSGVTLTAQPDPGAIFGGWFGGECGAASTCVVTVAAPTVVTAVFDAAATVLTVGKTGTGSGTVTSQPAGIDCGAVCSAGYAAATLVTLTATPATASTFAGWSGGGCSGTGACAVGLATSTTVTAAFQAVADLAVTIQAPPSRIRRKTQIQYRVNVTNRGPGVAGGTVLTVALNGLASKDLTSLLAPAGCAVSSNMVTCALGVLAAGASVQTVISVKPSGPATLDLTARVTATSPDPASANNSATVRTTVW